MRFLAPIVVLIGLGVVLGIGLNNNPRLVPSPLIGRAVPSFELEQLHDTEQTITEASLKGDVILLNVWATWCTACRQEHEMLLRIARETTTPIFGLNYKDARADALRWLEQLGNPYQAIAFDHDGKVALDLGVYGAPETYLVDASGRIAYKHIGPLTQSVWRETLAPLINTLRAGAG